MRTLMVRVVTMLALVAATSAAQNRVTVRGVVHDSLHAKPLAGAFVVAVGTSMSATTDSSGRFTFENVAPGTYRFAAQHDVIDALGMSAVGASATIKDGSETVRLFVPSFGQMWKVVCGLNPPATDTGFIFGAVRRAPGMKSLPKTVVSASWLDLVTDGKGVSQKQKTLEVDADSTGSFTLCGVPTTTGLAIRAAADSAESGTFAIDPLDTERIARRDLRLGAPLAKVVAEKRGATISGKVMADSGGGAIGNAEVSLADLGVKVTTNDKGEFTLVDVIPGSHYLNVKRIGYAETEMRVDVEETESIQRTVMLSKVVVLDSVGVSAKALARDQALRAYEEHKKLGLGKFMTREELEKAEGRQMSSLLNQWNGLSVVTGRDGKVRLLSRRGTKSIGTPNCPVLVYLDGVLYSPNEQPDINEFSPHELEAIEFFSGAGRIPPEYQRLNSPCGVLALHTRKK